MLSLWCPVLKYIGELRYQRLKKPKIFHIKYRLFIILLIGLFTEKCLIGLEVIDVNPIDGSSGRIQFVTCSSITSLPPWPNLASQNWCRKWALHPYCYFLSIIQIHWRGITHFNICFILWTPMYTYTWLVFGSCTRVKYEVPKWNLMPMF